MNTMHSHAPPPSDAHLPVASETTPLLIRVNSAGDNDSGSTSSRTESLFSPEPMRFKLYPVRWYVLVLFSLMTLFNNMLCYTFASVHRVSHRYYHGEKSSGVYASSPLGLGMSTLVSCYFVSYIVLSFPCSWFIERYGFKAGVMCGAWLQAIGCFVRMLATPTILINQANDESTPSELFSPHGNLSLLLTGQVIISLGQSFFINPAPLLAATWFGVDERTFATTIAVNANTLGIAVAYLLGPAIVDSVVDIPRYVMLCFIMTLFTALLTSIYFPSKPPTPPSHSQVIDNGDVLVNQSAYASPSPDEIMPTPSPVPSTSSASSSSPESQSESPSDSRSPSPSASPEVLLFHAPSSSSTIITCHDLDCDAECDTVPAPHGSPSSSSSSSAARSHRPPPSVTFLSTQSHTHTHAQSDSHLGHTNTHAHSHSHPPHSHRHSRSRSSAELALEHHLTSLPAPPCSFVVHQTLAEERKREKNASRLLASWHVFKRMFDAKGFAHTLLVFGVAEATINGLSTFMNQIVDPMGITDMRRVGWIVCAFIGMCMVGSAIIGAIVDKTKAFKGWILISLVGSSFGLFYLIHVGPLAEWHIWTAVCTLGLFVGPIQPCHTTQHNTTQTTRPTPERVRKPLNEQPTILLAASSLFPSFSPCSLSFLFFSVSIETGVEVTYPAPESSVTAVQQVLGNIFSALLFPLIVMSRDNQTHSMTRPLYIICACILATTLVYATFDGKYKRIAHEKEKERAHRDLHRRIHQEGKLARAEQERNALIEKINAQAHTNGITVGQS